MGLDKVTGNFAVGKSFDALLVDSDVPGSPYDIFEGRDNESDIVQKFLHLGEYYKYTKLNLGKHI